jgi:hypothetical protein
VLLALALALAIVAIGLIMRLPEQIVLVNPVYQGF